MSPVPLASFIIAATGHAIKPCQTIVWRFDNGVDRGRGFRATRKRRKKRWKQDGYRKRDRHNQRPLPVLRKITDPTKRHPERVRNKWLITPRNLIDRDDPRNDRIVSASENGTKQIATTAEKISGR